MTLIAHFEIQGFDESHDHGLNGNGSFWVLVDGGLDTAFQLCRKAIERKIADDPTAFKDCEVFPVDAYDLNSAEKEAFFALQFSANDSPYAIFQPSAFGIHAFQMLLNDDDTIDPFVVFKGSKPTWHELTEKADD